MSTTVTYFTIIIYSHVYMYLTHVNKNLPSLYFMSLHTYLNYLILRFALLIFDDTPIRLDQSRSAMAQ